MRSTALRRSEHPATRPLHRPGSGIIPGHGAENTWTPESPGFGGIPWDSGGKVGRKVG